jgi:hypothetical protein
VCKEDMLASKLTVLLKDFNTDAVIGGIHCQNNYFFHFIVFHTHMAVLR